MAIGTDALIRVFGTQDTVTTGTPSTVASGAWSDDNDTADWTNDEEAPNGAASLAYEFDTTFPAVGSIGLGYRLLDIDGANDEPFFTNMIKLLGSFSIAYGAVADTVYYTSIPHFPIPAVGPAQVIRYYIKNEGTSQTLGIGWVLKITPWTYAPKP